MPAGVPKSEIEQVINEEWNKEWENYKGARMSKNFFSKINKSKAKYIYKMSSHKLGRFIRIISGHNWLNYCQNKLDNNIAPTCRLCEEEDETFDHWVTSCPVLRKQRGNIFGIATNEYVIIADKWSVDEIMRFSFLPILASIIDSGDTYVEKLSTQGEEYTLEPD